VAKLKEEGGKDMGLLGSGDLAGQLMRRGLIDEYVLLIHPLILGEGRRLFPNGVFGSLDLTDSLRTSTGVLIATYQARHGGGP
jgi:dihydrofolate reductase